MLDLHQNAFTEFKAIPCSAKLDTISLSFNFLTNIDNLENAPNVSVIDLHNNKLKTLPTSLLKLYSLKTLNIGNNDLADINPRIGLLDNLIHISIEGNPLRTLKPSMRSANAVALKRYLKLRIDETVVAEEEKVQDAAKNLPGAKTEYDHWDICPA